MFVTATTTFKCISTAVFWPDNLSSVSPFYAQLIEKQSVSQACECDIGIYFRLRILTITIDVGDLSVLFI